MTQQLPVLAATLLFSAPGWAQDLGGRPDKSPSVEEVAPPEITSLPKVKTFVEAVYPEGAKTQGIEGAVGLIIQVDAAGTVVAAEVSRAAGHGFDEAATAAAKKMLFQPAMTADGPIGVAIEFEYRFELSPEDKAEGLPPVNLDGTVRQMGTRDPMSGVTVQVKINDVRFEAVTDSEGAFEFRGLPIGSAFAVADAAGHAATRESFKIKEGKVTSVPLWLRPNVSFDDAMVIEAERPEPDISRRSITVAEIKRIPGTFGDPVRVIQNLPGTARAPFGTGLVVVRGSNPEDTAFYVDGIRVPIIYHLGGLVSIVNEDLVGSVDYLPGGFGVEYGRSMGGVINIRTNQDYPERLRWFRGVSARRNAGVSRQLGAVHGSMSSSPHSLAVQASR